MENKIVKLKELFNKYVYLIIAVAVIATYIPSFKLLAAQTPWVNITMGKASVSTVALLIMWVIITEKVGKKRHWNSRKIMVSNVIGVGVLMLTVWFTPL